MQKITKVPKIKVILLGNRSVGKSSIIRRFVLDDFPLNIQVKIKLFSRQYQWITCRKQFNLMGINIVLNFGILQAKKSIDH
jgi:GTPase SAR1 family protein